MKDFGDSPVPDVPRIQRGKPKFVRPAISLHKPEKKEWRDVPPNEVEVGDVVFSFGLVAYKSVAQVDNYTLLENVMGTQKAWFGDEKVKAFVRVKSD